MDRQVISIDAAILPNAFAAHSETAGLQPWGCSVQRLRRASVLAAVRRRMAEEGYARFTLRMVAADCETTVQTIHNLIGNRKQVLADAIAEHGNVLSKVLPSPDEPYRILQFLDVIWHSIMFYPEYMRQASLGYAELHQRSDGSAHRAGIRFVQACLVDVRHLLRPSIDERLLAEAMSSSIATTVYEWATEKVDEDAVQSGLFTRTGLLLLGAITSSESDRLEQRLQEYRGRSTARIYPLACNR